MRPHRAALTRTSSTSTVTTLGATRRTSAAKPDGAAPPVVQISTLANAMAAALIGFPVSCERSRDRCRCFRR